MNEWEEKIYKELVQVSNNNDVYSANTMYIIKREIKQAILETRPFLDIQGKVIQDIFEKRGI